MRENSGLRSQDSGVRTQDSGGKIGERKYKKEKVFWSRKRNGVLSLIIRTSYYLSSHLKIDDNSTPKLRRKWREIQGKATYHLVGEDAQ